MNKPTRLNVSNVSNHQQSFTTPTAGNHGQGRDLEAPELDTEEIADESELRSVYNLIQKIESRFDSFSDDLPRIRELHARLEEAHRVISGFPQMPLLRDVLLLRDRLSRQVGGSGDDVREDALDEIDEILARQGVERIPFLAGAFDPSVQEAVERRGGESESPTDHAIELRRDGFVFQGRLLRPQQVVVGSRHEA